MRPSGMFGCLAFYLRNLWIKKWMFGRLSSPICGDPSTGRMAEPPSPLNRPHCGAE